MGGGRNGVGVWRGGLAVQAPFVFDRAGNGRGCESVRVGWGSRQEQAEVVVLLLLLVETGV